MFKKSGGGSLVWRVANSASVAVGDLSWEFLVRFTHPTSLMKLDFCKM